ncbi:E3 ubiquitin-protein ligase MARCH2 [Clonorchis sinensis]|uniref:E3 ubiquitin-protein ligase MARCH2 n=1 Tax=Clonorchis sinensis TaxID=79923 RepID=H2KTS5_CLOSI|nr:E3 ubiquitin-protein ligase MARCH2 [Clonorchis sinensis]
MVDYSLSANTSSPFQSSSRHTGPAPTSAFGPKRFISRSSFSRSRANDSDCLRSPECSRLLQSRPPNAPRPSLQITDDNVLFANTKQLGQRCLLRKSMVSQLNRESITQSLFNDSHNCIEDNAQDRYISIPKTSTPFVKRGAKFNLKNELLNSALIGAPRLALNLSVLSNSSENSDQDALDQCVIDSDSKSSNKLEKFDQVPHSPPTSRSSPIQTSIFVPKTDRCVPPDGEVSQQQDDLSFNQFRCRICLDEGELEGPLMSPCRCKGTVGLVHRNCLQRWLYESGKVKCELCGYEYIMTPSRRRSLPTFTRPRSYTRLDLFCAWLRSNTTRRHLMADIICLVLLTPSTYIGVYFCIVGAMGFAMENPFAWQAIGLWLLAILLIILLTSWMILAIRHHVSTFQRHMYYQRERERLENERFAALPRWRFSIQPRPRGSSLFLRSSTEREATGDLGTLISSESGPPTPVSNLHCSNPHGDFEFQAHIIPQGSSEHSGPISPKFVVSVALSTVPEVTEEYTHPSTEHGSPNMKFQPNFEITR